MSAIIHRVIMGVLAIIMFVQLGITDVNLLAQGKFYNDFSRIEGGGAAAIATAAICILLLVAAIYPQSYDMLPLLRWIAGVAMIIMVITLGFFDFSAVVNKQYNFDFTVLVTGAGMTKVVVIYLLGMLAFSPGNLYRGR